MVFVKTMNDVTGLEERIAELREEFGNLLDEDALRRLALDELGELVTNSKKIADLKDKEAATLEVRVAKAYEIREFTRKDGSPGRVRNIMIEDDTGGCRMVLWDDDVYLLEGLYIAEGDVLELANFYVRFSDYGIEVTKGKMGRLRKIE